MSSGLVPEPDAMRRLRRDKPAMLSLALLFLISLTAFLAPATARGVRVGERVHERTSR